MSGFHRFIAREMFYLKLQILREKFTQEYGPVEEPGCEHPLAQIRGKMPCALDNSFRIVSRHSDVGISGSGCLRGLLDVHQAEVLSLVRWFTDAEHHSEAEPP